MSNHQSDLYAAFAGGSTFGCITSLKLWFAQINTSSFAFEVGFEIIAIVIISAVGGIVGMFAKDVYTYWIQPKVKKLLNKKK